MDHKRINKLKIKTQTHKKFTGLKRIGSKLDQLSRLGMLLISPILVKAADF